MATHAYLENLIARITFSEQVADSSTSVSWHALREAEKLADIALFRPLEALLNVQGDIEFRRAIYFILGALGENLSSTECAELLISRSTLERDKYVLADIFQALAKNSKPLPVDISPVYRYLNDKRWLVRHSAISALSCSSSPECEDRLLEILDKSTDKFDITYAQATLNRIGTSRSLDKLRANLSSRKPDVKVSAEMAINAIERRAEERRQSAES